MTAAHTGRALTDPGDAQDGIMATASTPVPLFIVARLILALTSATVLQWVAHAIAGVGVLFACMAATELWSMGTRGRVAAAGLGALTLLFAFNTWL